MPLPLILASTSPYRKAILTRLGLNVSAHAPDYDERPIEGLDPIACVLAHGRNKALSLRTRFQDRIIIGSDQGLRFEQTLLGKPHTFDAACQQLAAMQGKTAQLITSLAVLPPPPYDIQTHIDITTLHFRPLTNTEIQHYILADQPLDCAGSFKIESRGPLLFEAIETRDPTAIEGIPCMALCRFLAEIEKNTHTSLLFAPKTQD